MGCFPFFPDVLLAHRIPTTHDSVWWLAGLEPAVSPLQGLKNDFVGKQPGTVDWGVG